MFQHLLSGTTPSPISDQAGAPIGWKLVPIEPTPEMAKAGMDQWYKTFTQHDLYVAMVTAAPTAQTTGSAPVAVKAFGTGAQVVIEGTFDGDHAVLILPAKQPGEVGASAKREEPITDDSLIDAVVLTFPTAEQVERVANALVAASPAASVLPIQRYAVFETQDGRGPHIVEEPCNTGKWVKYADLAAYSPAVSLDVQNVLCNVTQILDTVKMEWSATNSWSEWDQSVRDSITALLAASIGGDKS